MSDPNTTPDNEPVDETTSVDEAVARANEGLADAEAAGNDAVAEPDEVIVVEETVVAEPAPEPVAEDAVVAEQAWYDKPLEETPGAADAEEPIEAAAPTAAYTAPAEAYTAPADVFVAAAAAQPIFVQAPEEPLPRGNRGAAGAIGLLAALSFAVLLFAAQFVAFLLLGMIEVGESGDFAVALLTSWTFWTPVVAFFLGFWILGAVLNRARWAHWVIWGLLVGAVSYAGYILGAFLQAPFWELTASEGADLFAGQLFAPFAIVSFVLGREITIWFGAWVAARGRRMIELNAAAQLEYERTLEAGPQLYQQ